MVLRSMAEPRITARTIRPATIIVSRMVLLWQARHPRSSSYMFTAFAIAPAAWRYSPRSAAPAKQLGRRAPTEFTLIIDIRQLLPASVTHDETVWREFGSPRRREAACLISAPCWCRREVTHPSEIKSLVRK